MSSRMSGFTLIEVMVALLLMAVLSILSWRALDSMVHTRDTLLQHGKKDDQLKILFNLWEKDSAQVGPQITWLTQPPVHLNESEMAFVRLKTLPDGVSLPVVVLYQQYQNQLIRYESHPLQTQQQLLSMWSQVLSEQSMDRALWASQVVVLPQVKHVEFSVFLDGIGWIKTDQALNESFTHPALPRTYSLLAAKLSLTLGHDLFPYQKIALMERL